VITTGLEKLREHAAWSRQLEERCRPHLPEMTDASFRRIVGSMVDIEAHARRGMRSALNFLPSMFETSDGRMLVLLDTELATLRQVVRECLDERYGPAQPQPLTVPDPDEGDAT
jgi:hypothetical protein